MEYKVKSSVVRCTIVFVKQISPLYAINDKETARRTSFLLRSKDMQLSYLLSICRCGYEREFLSVSICVSHVTDCWPLQGVLCPMTAGIGSITLASKMFFVHFMSFISFFLFDYLVLWCHQKKSFSFSVQITWYFQMEIMPVIVKRWVIDLSCMYFFFTVAIFSRLGIIVLVSYWSWMKISLTATLNSQYCKNIGYNVV